MLRRINYTGRQKITQEDFRITLRSDTGTAGSFEASLQLAGYQFPADAPVFIEVQRKTFYMRFNYGTAGNLVTPKNTQLTLFPSSNGLLFRVKVISAGSPHGKLLAEGEFRTINQEPANQSRLPLLPAREAALGNRVWRLSIQDGDVTIEINEKLSDWRSVARSEEFIALVYPEIFTSVLERILKVEDHFDWEGEDWMSRWLRYCKNLPGLPTFPQRGDPDEQLEEWIDLAAAAVATRLSSLEKYQALRALEVAR